MNDIIEYKGQRVLTTHRLAESYGVTRQVISNNFNNNRERYVEGEHFFFLEGPELREFLSCHKISDKTNIPKLYLWTERGAMRHAKSLGTDEAWELFDKLVDTYFRAKELSTQGKRALPGADKVLPAFNARVLSATNSAARVILPALKAAGMGPEFIAVTVQGIYKQAGIDVPLAGIKLGKQLFDLTTIAEKLGVLSETGRPHPLAIGAIISMLDVSENDSELVPYNKNGHSGTTMQYNEKVLSAVKHWLSEHDYPAIIVAGGKNFKVQYKVERK